MRSSVLLLAVRTVGLCIAGCVLCAQLANPDGGPVQPGVLGVRWTTGGPKCMEVPDWQVHEYNEDFYILRESGCNPHAQNNWDGNAKKGTPSKGLLQVIDPTFKAYHVPGTAHSVTDPVANITAAANYAAHRYGSIDNVHSAY